MSQMFLQYLYTVSPINAPYIIMNMKYIFKF